MRLKSFIKNEKYKLLATVVVASFFLYFWINGPIVDSEEEVALEHEENEYTAPKLVESDSVMNSSQDVQLIEDTEDGYGIIVSEADENQAHSDRAEALLKHAAEICEGQQNIAHTEVMMFVEIVNDDGSFTYFESKDVISDVHGYAGPINIGVLVDEYGKIVRVEHISSVETDSYLQKIKNQAYYEAYENMRISGEYTIDAVSGATLTSSAIAETASELLAKARPEPLATRSMILPGDSFKVTAELDKLWILHILVILILFIYGVQKKWRKTKTGILIVSLLSVAYIGFFLNNSFTYVSFIHPFLGTSVSSLVGLYALLTLLGAIWGKNTYCKYVCPFGNMQRLVMRFGPNKKRKFFFTE